MESLAVTVTLILVLSIALAATALLFAILYSRGRVGFRAALIWIVLAAVDLGFLVSSGQWRAYILQLLLVTAAMAVTIRTRREQF